MQLFLDDSQHRERLFPFTHTRHTADIRIGILTIREKWKFLTGYIIADNHHKSLVINSNILPSKNNYTDILANKITNSKTLEYPWQIFQYNDWAIREDFKMLTEGRKSEPLSSTNKVIGIADDIFIEEGAQVEHSILNTVGGPIYIGKNALIMEGNMIRGPFAICERAVLKMGSKVYGATTIGPFCTAGGEIKNSVLFGYSNKAHDGYLGDSVLGEWCNLGAGTSNSNVKNTGGEVKYTVNNAGDSLSAGNKAGLLMGDYSRAAINTSFNTGTVVGVCCNIFGENFPGKYIANFSWGKDRYDLEKAFKDISNWKKMKGQAISEAEKTLLEHLYKSNQ
ncbi:GlmU family protein [soil metagenome]